MEIIRDVERKREKELAERVITLASKGGAASLGLADTLGAIYEGRVHILVVAEGYGAKGYRCEGCGYLSAQEIGRCLFCGGDVVEIEDAVNLAVRRVVEGGGRVEIIRESDALRKAGNIGAILRY
jgi:peptide subunit release factor 1 (eRF1)